MDSLGGREDSWEPSRGTPTPAGAQAALSLDLLTQDKNDRFRAAFPWNRLSLTTSPKPPEYSMCGQNYVNSKHVNCIRRGLSSYVLSMRRDKPYLRKVRCNKDLAQ